MSLDEHNKELIDNVKEIVNGGEVVDKIILLTVTRLESWGVKELEVFELSYAVMSTIEFIKNTTNQIVVPEGLTFTAVDLVCGELLSQRLDAGNLPEFDVDKAVKSIKVGDTTTTFQDEGKSGIEMLINGLMSGKDDLISHRKLKW